MQSGQNQGVLAEIPEKNYTISYFSEPEGAYTR